MLAKSDTLLVSPFKIGYVLLHFPRLTETFVAEEIRAVKELGSQVDIISLLACQAGARQPLSEELLKHAWYAPGFATGRLWRGQLYYFSKSPRIYLRLLFTLLRQPAPTHLLSSLAKRFGIFLKASASARYLESQNLDHLHSHFAWLPGAAASIIAGLIRLPYTVTVHAYDLFASNELLPLVCGQAQRVIAISEYNKQEIIRLKACPAERISVIRCGIDLDQFPPPHYETAEAEGLSPLRILSVGSLLPKKGHRFLIQACAYLRAKGVDLPVRLSGMGLTRRLSSGKLKIRASRTVFDCWAFGPSQRSSRSIVGTTFLPWPRS